VEGYEDHTVNLLYTWDNSHRLTGVLVNIACPAQLSETEYLISADFWHDTRQELRKRYTEDLYILAQCSSAGDQNPRPQLYKKAEDEMLKRKGITARRELALRITEAVESVYPWAKQEIRDVIELRHVVKEVRLPSRQVTPRENEDAEREIERLEAKKPFSPGASENRLLERNLRVKQRFQEQKDDDVFTFECHILRIGDVAMVTNPFELFLDYGLRIKAQAKALNTFVVQLACGSGGYLPTPKAVQGGSYEANPASNEVGPDGGVVLVEKSVRMINNLFEE
jgi:hypothetical protein